MTIVICNSNWNNFTSHLVRKITIWSAIPLDFVLFPKVSTLPPAVLEPVVSGYSGWLTFTDIMSPETTEITSAESTVGHPKRI